jgi:hypothetical protein
MQQVIAVLKSRKTTIPLVCVVGSIALLTGLVSGGVIDVQQTAILVVAAYVGSKVLMAGVALWVLWKHSGRMQQAVARWRRRLF